MPHFGTKSQFELIAIKNLLFDSIKYNTRGHYTFYVLILLNYLKNNKVKYSIVYTWENERLIQTNPPDGLHLWIYLDSECWVDQYDSHRLNNEMNTI